MTDRDDLVVDFDLVIPRQGKRIAGLSIEVVRPLTAGDIPALCEPLESGPVASDSPTEMRHSHHLLAQLIAQGSHSMTDISYITGYSPAYISKLKNSPAFEELLAGYAAERELLFIDVAERMKNLGLDAVAELQARLAEEPKAWTRREVMELAELMLLKGREAPGSAKGAGQRGTGSGPVAIEISFVKPGDRGVVIDQ